MPRSFCSNSVRPVASITVVVALVSSLHPIPAEAGGLFGDVMALPKAASAAVTGSVPAENGGVGTNSGTTASPGKIDISKDLPLKPLSNQLIELCSVTGNDCVSQVTDATGYYQFDDIESGTYRLQTLGSDGALLKNEITVPADTFKELRVLAR
ncbi:MAG TPA: hypothetical protein VIN77_03845 [Aurantimonas sp.]|uniref:Carboxypeptidase regulatory-like domain-containing protein n=1 Tax=Aurantimonas marianensis TaxID=2920428 RepID=A0A9X2H9P5_9HYPH|nr:hypothetical protein [Aurantimonas marianensis]MCP3055848.1 hypothetical protein [Aurantimonas marianensis]